jgi:hypothetical protein
VFAWLGALAVCAFCTAAFACPAYAETIDVNLNELADDFIIETTDTYVFSGTTTHSIIVGDGVQANMILDGVDITAESGKAAIDASKGVGVTVELAEGSENEVSGGYKAAGIRVPVIDQETFDSHPIQLVEYLNIKGPGSIVAKGGADGAGIGGSEKDITGTLYISSCSSVKAYGGDDAPGIGAGYDGSYFMVSISSSDVYAEGGWAGPGIGIVGGGTGYACCFYNSTVKAVASFAAPGIGAGLARNGSGYFRWLYVNGSNVVATGHSVPGIGSYADSEFGSALITNGSVVRATGWSYGIGDGQYSVVNHGQRTLTVDGSSIVDAKVQEATSSNQWTTDFKSGIVLDSGNLGDVVYGTVVLTEPYETSCMTIPSGSILKSTSTIINDGVISVAGRLDAAVENQNDSCYVQSLLHVEGGEAIDASSGEPIENNSYVREGTEITLVSNDADVDYGLSYRWLVNNVTQENGEFTMPANPVIAEYANHYGVILPSDQNHYSLAVDSYDAETNTYTLALSYDDGYERPCLYSGFSELYCSDYSDHVFYYSVQALDYEDVVITVDGPRKYISLRGLVAQDKVYDGTTDVTVTGGYLDGVEAGDDVSFSIDSAHVSSADAGSRSVTMAVSLTGKDADKYILNCDNPVVTISKAPQDAPSELAATSETVSGKQDGSISGLTSAMEWRAAGSETYTSVAAGQASLDNLAPGTYEIRFAGDANHDPSPDAEVVVGEGSTFTVSAPEVQRGYTLEVDKTSLAYGETATVIVSIANNYTASDAFAFTAFNATVTANGDGTFTVSGATGDVQLLVSGVVYAAPPAVNGVQEGYAYTPDTVVTIDTEIPFTVTANGEPVDVAENSFTLEGLSGDVELVVTDEDGNTATVHIVVTEDGLHTSTAVNDDGSTTVTKTDNDGAIVSRVTTLANGQTVTDGFVHVMLEGDGQTYAPGSDLVFRSNDVLTNLQTIRIDGNEIDSVSYTTSSGSTVVALKDAYLATLAPGAHALDIVSSNGPASGTFFVAENPVEPETPGETEDPGTSEALDEFENPVGTETSSDAKDTGNDQNNVPSASNKETPKNGSETVAQVSARSAASPVRPVQQKAVPDTSDPASFAAVAGLALAGAVSLAASRRR